VEEQAGKADRAKKAVQRAQRVLRGKLEVEAGGPPSEPELDMQLADVREVNRSMLQELSALASQHPGGSKRRCLLDASVCVIYQCGAGGRARSGSAGVLGQQEHALASCLCCP
jgi:hypothetical protein